MQEHYCLGFGDVDFYLPSVCIPNKGVKASLKFVRNLSGHSPLHGDGSIISELEEFAVMTQRGNVRSVKVV
jgi:hypothetical protein